MTDNVEKQVKQSNANIAPSKENSVIPAKTGIQFLTGLLFLLLFALTGVFVYSYLHLEKQNAALTQLIAQVRQQASEGASQVQSLAQAVQQMQQVNAYNNQDITELFIQLNALNDQLDQLPLPPMPLQQEALPASAADETGMSWWQKGLSRSWQALRQIVIVRYNDKKMMPLVMPEDRYFLYQNLHVQMQNAIWGVLHRNPAVYQISLANVEKWVQQYFVQQSPATINVLQALTTLRAVSIEQPMANNTGTT